MECPECDSINYVWEDRDCGNIIYKCNNCCCKWEEEIEVKVLEHGREYDK